MQTQNKNRAGILFVFFLSLFGMREESIIEKCLQLAAFEGILLT
jgi:hypothetical protein